MKRILILLIIIGFVLLLFEITPSAWTDYTSKARVAEVIASVDPVRADLERACAKGTQEWQAALGKVMPPAAGKNPYIVGSALGRRDDQALLHLVLGEITGTHFFFLKHTAVQTGSRLSFVATCRQPELDWRIEEAGFDHKFLPAELAAQLAARPAKAKSAETSPVYESKP